MAPLDDNQLRQTMRPETLSENARMFANRLRKNATHLKKWAARNGVSCYRLYDADLPEYAFAIDCYRDHIVLQEYVAPASIDPAIAAKRSLEVVRVVPYALEIAPDRVILKQRKPQRGSDQYQKIDHTRDRIAITEGRAQLLVNLQDYLDTGLFLDHRLLRLQFGHLKPLTRFLNCFCYTATASVHAALAGAHTTNVDLSNTYLAWGQDNFRLNHLDISRHQFIQYDCLTWLATTHDKFDVIFLDPPSFSNSKRMSETLDIQRDHVTLIQKAMRLLSPNGCLYFSTNFRQFKLDPVLETTYAVRDITPSTIDIDFKRNPRVHKCFTLMHHNHQKD
jgi:23S rRNA (guanine2445-N2)-methyltransferase / 23S rRNA (guanine2069-N7)-methyltransferase